MDNRFENHLMDTFKAQLTKNFLTYCAKHSLKPNLEHFTSFLVDNNLIKDSALQRYTIAAIYKEMQLESLMNKTQIVETLADRFNVATRSVWNILRSHDFKRK